MLAAVTADDRLLPQTMNARLVTRAPQPLAAYCQLPNLSGL
jgi:hypothetical protein